MSTKDLTLSSAIDVCHYITSQTPQKLSRRFVTETLQQSPHQPSLQVISSFLYDCQVDNLILEIEATNIREMKFPCITKLDSPEGPSFVVIESIKGNQVHLMQQAAPVDFPSFLEQWKENPVLIYDAEGYQPPKGFRQFKTRIRITAFILTAIISALLWAVFLKTTKVDILPNLSLLLLSGAGLWMVHLIVQKSLGHSLSALNRFCQVKKADGCQVILQSSLAYPLPGISWSSIGFVFFLSLLLYYFISPAIQLSAIGFMYLISLPGVLLALLIQHFLSELWCRLCLAVHALLLSGAGLALWVQRGWVWPEVSELPYLMISMALGWVGWQTYHRYQASRSQATSEKQDLIQAKFHPLTLHGHFAHAQPLPYPLDIALRLGQANTSIDILIITNPGCHKCAAAHPYIEQLYHRHDHISISYLFHVYQQELEQSGELVRYLYQMHRKDPDLFMEGMQSWYADITQGIAQWKQPYQQHLTDHHETSMLPLLEFNAVSQVPAVYLNGAKLPDFYEFKDLAELLPWFNNSQ